MGEVVAMFVMREQSEQGKALTKKDIVNHIDRVLASQAKPDWIWFMGEDLQALEWPKTASGKIRKIDLKEIAKPLLEMGIGKMRI